MLKLKLQYFGYLMLLTGKILMLGKIEGRRRRRPWLDGWLAMDGHGG